MPRATSSRSGWRAQGAYGAELARFLTASGITVVEVDRPDRKARRARGKSDPIDAYAAATAVLSGRASGTPKSRNGIVEAIRALRVVRKSAVKARTQTINQIRSLMVTAPSALRDKLRGLPTGLLIDTLARTRPTGDLTDPACATKTALRCLARRYQVLQQEIKEADADLAPLVRRAAPSLVALPGVGTETAGQLQRGVHREGDVAVAVRDGRGSQLRFSTDDGVDLARGGRPSGRPRVATMQPTPGSGHPPPGGSTDNPVHVHESGASEPQVHTKHATHSEARTASSALFGPRCRPFARPRYAESCTSATVAVAPRGDRGSQRPRRSWCSRPSPRVAVAPRGDRGSQLPPLLVTVLGAQRGGRPSGGPRIATPGSGPAVPGDGASGGRPSGGPRIATSSSGRS
ncbi:IS110 family transposase [Streptomyces lavendulae]|uniref:IS110 family transposase n=1 Tax=Streptomyces lavendulae TaxID=1914 RepID=UPI000AD342A8